MLELRFIRENIELVKAKTAKRGMDIAMLDRFMEVDRRRLAILG
jgi:seryl-tRNA synthetase